MHPRPWDPPEAQLLHYGDVCRSDVRDIIMLSGVFPELEYLYCSGFANSFWPRDKHGQIWRPCLSLGGGREGGDPCVRGALLQSTNAVCSAFSIYFPQSSVVPHPPKREFERHWPSSSTTQHGNQTAINTSNNKKVAPARKLKREVGRGQ